MPYFIGHMTSKELTSHVIVTMLLTSSHVSYAIVTMVVDVTMGFLLKQGFVDMHVVRGE